MLASRTRANWATKALPGRSGDAVSARGAGCAITSGWRCLSCAVGTAPKPSRPRKFATILPVSVVPAAPGLVAVRRFALKPKTGVCCASGAFCAVSSAPSLPGAACDVAPLGRAGVVSGFAAVKVRPSIAGRATLPRAALGAGPAASDGAGSAWGAVWDVSVSTIGVIVRSNIGSSRAANSLFSCGATSSAAKSGAGGAAADDAARSGVRCGASCACPPSLLSASDVFSAKGGAVCSASGATGAASGAGAVWAVTTSCGLASSVGADGAGMASAGAVSGVELVSASSDCGSGPSLCLVVAFFLDLDLATTFSAASSSACSAKGAASDMVSVSGPSSCCDAWLGASGAVTASDASGAVMSCGATQRSGPKRRSVVAVVIAGGLSPKIGIPG